MAWREDGMLLTLFCWACLRRLFVIIIIIIEGIMEEEGLLNSGFGIINLILDSRRTYRCVILPFVLNTFVTSNYDPKRGQKGRPHQVAALTANSSSGEPYTQY